MILSFTGRCHGCKASFWRRAKSIWCSVCDPKN